MKKKIKKKLTDKQKFNRLKRAVKKLYTVGYWDLTYQVNPEYPSIGKQRKLWENVRDAAEIPKGTATKLRSGIIDMD